MTEIEKLNQLIMFANVFSELPKSLRESLEDAVGGYPEYMSKSQAQTLKEELLGISKEIDEFLNKQMEK